MFTSFPSPISRDCIWETVRNDRGLFFHSYSPPLLGLDDGHGCISNLSGPKGWRSGSSGRMLPSKCKALNSNPSTTKKPLIYLALLTVLSWLPLLLCLRPNDYWCQMNGCYISRSMYTAISCPYGPYLWPCSEGVRSIKEDMVLCSSSRHLQRPIAWVYRSPDLVIQESFPISFCGE
jgi:hypothetical protein